MHGCLRAPVPVELRRCPRAEPPISGLRPSPEFAREQVQLYKISHLDFMVRRHVNRQQQARKAESARPAPSAPVSAGGAARAETIADKVARIKIELALDQGLPMATAVKEAFTIMGMTPEGPLPAQVDLLLTTLGI